MTVQAPSRISVGLLDDHPIIAAGLEAVLNATSDIVFRGVAQTQKDLFAMVESHRLDVVILDIRLPEANGLDVCRRLREKYPATRALILTSVFEEWSIKAAFPAGATGYALKNISFELVPLAIRQVHHGGIYLAPEIAARAAGLAIEATQPPHPGSTARITGRQRDIIRLIREGKSNKEIALEVGVSYHTVKFHVSRLLQSHGYHSRAQLVQLFKEG